MNGEKESSEGAKQRFEESLSRAKESLRRFGHGSVWLRKDDSRFKKYLGIVAGPGSQEKAVDPRRDGIAICREIIRNHEIRQQEKRFAEAVNEFCQATDCSKAEALCEISRAIEAAGQAALVEKEARELDREFYNETEAKEKTSDWISRGDYYEEHGFHFVRRQEDHREQQAAGGECGQARTGADPAAGRS